MMIKINKYVIGAILFMLVLIAFFIWRAIDNYQTRERRTLEQIEILSSKVKQDSIKAENLRKRGDSLQTVAKAFEVRASVEHLARLELLAAQQRKEAKKIKNATARESVFAFVWSVDSNNAVVPDLIAQGRDTITPIPIPTIKKANLLFLELNFARQTIEEHKVFEDDLIYIINDLNESANTLRTEADTWKKSTEDLKKINEHMDVIVNRREKSLARSKTWNTLLLGALGLASVKVIFF